jgi:hypothetical protein
VVRFSVFRLFQIGIALENFSLDFGVKNYTFETKCFPKEGEKS